MEYTIGGRVNCPTVDCLFLRANGRIVCWDAKGSDRILQEHAPERDMSQVYSMDGPCARAAEALGGGRLPDPEVCPGCFCLSMAGRPHFNQRILETLQVEPSARCTLRCPACATPEERAALPPPDLLEPDVFEHILGDFTRAGKDILSVEFSGHGEPLLNPDLPLLVRMARSHFPQAFLFLVTNGQGTFTQELADCGLDQVQVAIDGVDQETYEGYRIGGSFQLALSFLATVAETGRVHAVWRYILFRHNSENAHLRRAWELASEMGVDEIRVILTRIGDWSRSIPTAEVLRTSLLSIGVPSSCLLVESPFELRRRRRLKNMLKSVRPLRRALISTWQSLHAKSLPNGSKPVVRSDCCGMDLGELRRTLQVADSYLRKGHFGLAADLLRHVERCAANPGRHNPSYDVGETLRSLGDAYRTVREAVTGSDDGMPPVCDSDSTRSDRARVVPGHG